MESESMQSMHLIYKKITKKSKHKVEEPIYEWNKKIAKGTAVQVIM